MAPPTYPTWKISMPRVWSSRVKYGIDTNRDFLRFCRLRKKNDAVSFISWQLPVASWHFFYTKNHHHNLPISVHIQPMAMRTLANGYKYTRWYMIYRMMSSTNIKQITICIYIHMYHVSIYYMGVKVRIKFDASFGV